MWGGLKRSEALGFVAGHVVLSWLLAVLLRPVWSFVIKREEPEVGEPGLVSQFDTSPLLALLLLLPLAWWLKRRDAQVGPELALVCGFAGLVAYAPQFLGFLVQDIELVMLGESAVSPGLAVLSILVRWLFAGLLVALISLPVWLASRALVRRLP